MALRVVQSPGCRAIYSDADLGLHPGDIVIDTGTIAAAIGFDPLSPTANTGLLRVASRLRGLAIKAALEDGISGVVRTSNTKKRSTAPGRDGRHEGGSHRAVARRSVPSHTQDLSERPRPGGRVRTGVRQVFF